MQNPPTMALPSGEEGCLPDLLAMDKDEVFRVIDAAIAFAAWKWPEELVARRAQIVNGLHMPPVKHDQTGSSSLGGNPTRDHEKIEEKMELITPITMKEAPRKFVVRLHVPNVVTEAAGVIAKDKGNPTHDYEKIEEKMELITPITTTKEAPKKFVVRLHVPNVVPKAAGAIGNPTHDNQKIKERIEAIMPITTKETPKKFVRPSGDVKSKEYSSCGGMKQERPKNVDFSQEKLESLSTKLRKRYQECQGSRKRSRVIPFHEAPKPNWV